jgi:hypothetical protein
MRELSILEMLNDLNCGDKKETTVKMEGRNSMSLDKQTGKNPVEWMRKCSCGKLLSKNNIHCKNYPHPYMEKQWLSEQYWEKKHTMREMAKLSNSSYVTIWTWMKKLHPLLEKMVSSQTNHCLKTVACNQEFENVANK